MSQINENLIHFTPEKVKALRASYEKALQGGKEVFVFEDRDYVTGYAKYLLEYLEPRLGGPGHG